MFRQCCVPQCKSLRQNSKLHQLPAKKELRMLWLKYIGSKSVCETTNNMYVCHKHFELKFINPATNRLKSGAYPSLFTDCEISSGNSSMVRTETVVEKIRSDHAYTRKLHIEHSYSKPIERTPDKVKLPNPEIRVSYNMDSTQPAINIYYSSEIQDTEDICTMEPAVTNSSSVIQDTQDFCTMDSMEHAVGTSSSGPHDNDIRDFCTMDSMDSMESAVATSSSVLQDSYIRTSTEPAVATSSSGIQDKQVSSCKKPRKLVTRKIIHNVKTLPPKYQLLYKEYKKAKRQNEYRSKKSLASKDKKTVLEKLTKKMNPLAQKFMWMQVKLSSKNKEGRRFTREEKLIALSIYKQGTKSYKFLQKIFIMPSRTTLKKMISELNNESGINPSLFNDISQQEDE